MIAAEFKVGVVRVLKCWPNLYHTKHALLWKSEGMPPENFLKFTLLRLNLKACSSDGKYEALKKLTEGGYSYLIHPMDQSLAT